MPSPATQRYYHLHLVSDATGETLNTVAKAAAAQYSGFRPIAHIYALVGQAAEWGFECRCGASWPA